MYQPVNLQHPSEKGTNKKKALLILCVFTTKCIFIIYSQLISFCGVMVRKRSLQPSCIIVCVCVCVVTFCLYHGLGKKKKAHFSNWPKGVGWFSLSRRPNEWVNERARSGKVFHFRQSRGSSALNRLHSEDARWAISSVWGPKQAEHSNLFHF